MGFHARKLTLYWRRVYRHAALAAALAIALSSSSDAQSLTANLNTGNGATAVAVNPVTNKIYVTDVSNYVTVVDGVSNSTIRILAGTTPVSAAVNSVTNKIYVANNSSNNVTVIDGTSNRTTTVAAGTLFPCSAAVNPVTNKIYVANANSDNVTVIDGASKSTTTIFAGTYPSLVAVNPVTNKIYVVSYIRNNVTVIDGASNFETTVSAGTTPTSLAVNPVTNKIYVVNNSSNSVTVIDGASNIPTTVPADSDGESVAVNPLTNKIYVTDGGAVTVIDGASDKTGFVSVDSGSYSIAVNPVTNKIYVAGLSSVTVIDGASNIPTTIAAGTYPLAVAVNPVTNKIYVANASSNNVTVIDEQPVQPIPLTTSITPLPGNQTGNPNPSFAFDAFSSMMTTPDEVFFRVDTWQNAWNNATGSNPSFDGTVPTLQPGFHILYSYAVDGQEAQNGSPLTGAIQVYGFLVTAPTPTAKYRGLDTTTEGTWTNTYGANGYTVVNASNTLPFVRLAGGYAHTWAASTSDPRALQVSSGSSARIASAYYSATSFTIDVNLTDENTHTISLYLLDWDSTSRAETISIKDAVSNAILDTETFSNFNLGQYASWYVKGHVLIQVTRTGGANAVVSGIFFDLDPVLLTSPAAQYIGVDTTTWGTWTGQYGAGGQLIANDAGNLPAYATVSLTGDMLHTWDASTSDSRALQVSSGSSARIASAYYQYSSFAVDLNITDGKTHRIALYLLDWDLAGRAETISIMDAASNAVLDTERFSNFTLGQYASWYVTGHVLIQVTAIGGLNAAVSGIFFD